MITYKRVYVTTTVEGWHRWPNAQKPRTYLEGLHRHLFHVKVAVHVDDANREVEFHNLLEDVRAYIDTLPLSQEANSSLSCEQLALKLIGRMRTSPVYASHTLQVEWSEDGENGAVVTCIPEAFDVQPA